MVVGGRDPLEQQHALGEHQLDVHPGADLDAGVVQPGADRVAPRLHLEGPRTLGVGAHGGSHPRDLPGDAVHPLRRAAYAVGVGEHHLGAELVVSLAEHQGGHVEELAHGRLGRVARQVDDGCHVHDRDTADHGARLSESGAFTQTLARPCSSARHPARHPGGGLVGPPPSPPDWWPSARFSVHPQLPAGQLVTRHLTVGWSAVSRVVRPGVCWIDPMTWASVLPCEPSDVSLSVRCCRSRCVPWGTWPPTCGGPGTRRRRTSSRRWIPTSGARAATTRSRRWARSPRPA